MVKYSLPSRMSNNILKKADEIKISLYDFSILENLITDFPEKDIVLCIPSHLHKDVDYNELIRLKNLTKGSFSCELETLDYIDQFKELNIDFFYRYPIDNFYELRAVVEQGVSQILVDAPLFFSLKKVKQLYPNLKVRVIPNICQKNDFILSSTGIYGSWILPQNMSYYEGLVDICEFGYRGLSHTRFKQYETLLKLYKEEGKWDLDLNFVLLGLNEKGVLGACLLPELFEQRVNCGQRCMQGEPCTMCIKSLDVARLLGREKIKELELQNIIEEKENI